MNLLIFIIILDISTNAKTKEEYLSKGCQARIRGYLSKARTQLFATKFDTGIVTNVNKQPTNGDSGQISYTKECSKSSTRHRGRRMPVSLDGSRDVSDEYCENEENVNQANEQWDEIDAKRINEYKGIVSHLGIGCVYLNISR